MSIRSRCSGHPGPPAQFAFDPDPQRVRGVRLAVRDVGHPRRLRCGLHPVDEAVRVGVRGQVLHLDDFGPDLDVLAVDPDLTLPGGERGAAGAAGLVAAEDDGVLGVRAVRGEVVQDPAAGEHAAGRDDDHRSAAQVQQLGVVHAAGELGEAVHVLVFVPFEPVLLRVPLVHVRRRRWPSGC